MTTRLKRKLGDLGVDTSSAKANENFCLIGTPLPPLEKSKDTGEFVPLWKQDVRDEKGRRRLHGAFTGGFSAGYFNTVGSKEGWTPSTFVSSRGDRAKTKAARPEDFMDEEDLSELKESRSLVDTNEQTDIFEFRSGTQELHVERKDNAHGLGYTPGLSLNESVGAKTASKSGPKISAGFGLGALNDAEEDDIDVYEDSSKENTRMTHNAFDRDEEETISIGIKSARNESSRNSGLARSSATLKDGRHVLAGFFFSDEPVVEDQWYPVPDIPNGWTPDPKRVWDLHKENIDPSSTTPTNQAQWKKGISADERGVVLGEKPVLTASRSVFEYMSQKDRERLNNITHSMSMPVSQPPSTAPSAPFIPHTEPHIAEAALQGFRPFTSSPEKQARYTAYLQSQASPGSSLSLQPKPGQSTPDFTQELSEYAKSAVIFKPISGAMASRFVSARSNDSAPQYQEGFYKPSIGDTTETEPTPSTPLLETPEKTNSRADAAKLGMFGAMTREVKAWQPAKLLCKRFGVKDPNPEPVPELAKESNLPPAASSWTPESAAAGASVLNGSVAKAGTKGGNSNHGVRDLANIGLGDDDHQGEDTLTYERPSMDIFKAIFASDGEDSGDEQDTNVEGRAPPGNIDTAETSEAKLPSTVAPASAGKIDLTTFKPTFVPRSDKQKKTKKKDKKTKSTLVSFQIEGDETEFRREKPKKPPKENNVEAKDNQMKQTSVQDGADRNPEVFTPQKKRKRAIDFM